MPKYQGCIPHMLVVVVVVVVVACTKARSKADYYYGRRTVKVSIWKCNSFIY